MDERFARGRVVVSLAGRDRGQLMAVLDTGTDGIRVADGRRRRVEIPKRKNPRHVAPTEERVSDTAMATNRELRRVLAALAVRRGSADAAHGESLEGG